MKKEEIDELIAQSVAESKGGRESKWHRPKHNRARVNQIRSVLNTLFMLGFVAAILIYFLLPEQRVLFFFVGFGALVLKIVEFIIRFKA